MGETIAGSDGREMKTMFVHKGWWCFEGGVEISHHAPAVLSGGVDMSRLQRNVIHVHNTPIKSLETLEEVMNGAVKLAEEVFECL